VLSGYGWIELGRPRLDFDPLCVLCLVLSSIHSWIEVGRFASVRYLVRVPVGALQSSWIELGGDALVHFLGVCCVLVLSGVPIAG
jgi:hypothetical protein